MASLQRTKPEWAEHHTKKWAQTPAPPQEPFNRKAPSATEYLRQYQANQQTCIMCSRPLTYEEYHNNTLHLNSHCTHTDILQIHKETQISLGQTILSIGAPTWWTTTPTPWAQANVNLPPPNTHS